MALFTMGLTSSENDTEILGERKKNKIEDVDPAMSLGTPEAPAFFSL
jgi:hypothetical protein